MPNLVDQIVVTIKRGREDDLPDAFLRAGWVFEKGRGQESDEWPEDIVAEPIYKEDLERLKKEISTFVERFPDHVHLPAAIESLGRLKDPSLKNILRKALKANLDKNPDALSCAMIALDDLGEEIFKKGVTYSGMELDEYQALAKKYLSTRHHNHH